MYLWTQFPEKIIRQFIYRDRLDFEDVVSEEDDDIMMMDDEDEGSLYNKIIYQHVPMIKDQYDYLYYVILLNKEMHIMEGNPRDPIMSNHQIIFTNKSKKCIGFSMTGSQFFYIDENKQISMLARTSQSRNLE